MANTTVRFRYKGPWPADVRAATEPAATFPTPLFAEFFDVTLDDTHVAALEERMKHWGCFRDDTTLVAQPTPFFGLVSPDGGIWELVIDNAGVLTTVKRN